MQLTGYKFNQYHLTRRLRRGGMGDIYRARDMKLGREVAIKIIRTDTITYADDEEAKEAARLFLREVQVVAKLDHRHILPLYDADEVQIDNMTLMYMVMPLREQGSLADWLKQYASGAAGVTLPPRYIERIIRQAALALQYAHDHDIVHKDVKLPNFLVRDPAQHPGQLYVQLADFGVAKLMSTTSNSMIIRGTTSHMAPEQWTGQAVPASDQYSLAIMAFELLTGQLPFNGNDNQQLWFQHTNVPPPPPGIINPAIPVELDAVLLRALAKTPQERFDSITAFAQAFRQALIDAHNQVQQTQQLAFYDSRPPITTQIQQTAFEPELEEQEIQPTRRGKLGLRAVMLTALALMLIGAGVIAASLFLLHPSDDGLPYIPSIGNSSQASPTPNLTATHNVYVTTTAQASATSGTRAVAETATAQAINDAGATATTVAQANAAATARASATALAESNATATITAYNSLSNAGTQSFDDTFQNNADNLNWDSNYSTTYGGCKLTTGGYLSSVPQSQSGTFSACYAEATQYTNFFYAAHLHIIKGDQGGLLFRGNSSLYGFYYFYIDTNGNYALDIYFQNSYSSTLISGKSNFINTMAGADNLLAVQAKGKVFSLYVNKHFLNTITDNRNTFSTGQVGVIASVKSNPTDVVFSEAMLSTL